MKSRFAFARFFVSGIAAITVVACTTPNSQDDPSVGTPTNRHQSIDSRKLEREVGWRVLVPSNDYAIDPFSIEVETFAHVGKPEVLMQFMGPEASNDIRFIQGVSGYLPELDSATSNEVIGRFEATVAKPTSSLVSVTFPTGERDEGDAVYAWVIAHDESDARAFIETLHFEE